MNPKELLKHQERQAALRQRAKAALAHDPDTLVQVLGLIDDDDFDLAFRKMNVSRALHVAAANAAMAEDWASVPPKVNAALHLILESAVQSARHPPHRVASLIARFVIEFEKLSTT